MASRQGSKQSSQKTALDKVDNPLPTDKAIMPPKIEQTDLR